MSTRRSERLRARRRKRRARRILLVVVILAVLTGIFFLAFPLNTVVVSGNVHESADRITELVLERPSAGNTVLAWLMNRNRKISGEEFVSSIQTEIVSSEKIRVHVTEKRLTGYVKSGKKLYYIGKDGTILADSAKPWEKDHIPEIDGLELLTDVRKGETLPIRGTKPFVLLDNLKSLTDFYRIPPDRITFSPENDMTLHYGNVEALLGNGTNLEDRVKQLAGILKEMDSNWSGTLHLENYSSSQGQVVFDRTSGS
jgi:cell division protein FtsQ